jgi:hypothetical protein
MHTKMASFQWLIYITHFELRNSNAYQNGFVSIGRQKDFPLLSLIDGLTFSGARCNGSLEFMQSYVFVTRRFFLSEC